MSMIAIHVLLLSSLTIQLITSEGLYDLNVCNPINQTAVPPPPPALPKSFTTRIEWKWIDTNQTISVREVHDGIDKMGSQTITMLGQTSQIIYDYSQHQYIVYNKETGCSATPLGNLAFYNNKFWLSATNMTYHLAAVEGHAPYMGQTVVRNISVGHWKSCLWLFSYNMTVDVDMYFSVDGWGMALSTPGDMIPVRFEMKGSHNYNITGSAVTYFHVIGDFIDFIPTPPTDLTPLQPPPGTFCHGRKSRTPMNPLPSSFSLIMENVDINYFNIKYETVWFHSTKKLIRRDFKKPSGSDPDPTIDIFDFNMGIHYTIDPYTGTCDAPATIGIGDLYAKSHGDNTLVMQTALDFFHVANAQIQYVGTRTVRGVACDVWIGIYLNTATAKNDTVEWYFTKANWVEAVDLAIQPAALIRMDIWQGGAFQDGVSTKPMIHNLYHFDPVAPTLDMFNVAPCYPASKKRRILISFKATNDKRVDKISARYLKGLLHEVITSKTFIDPLRLTEIMLEYQDTSTVYFAATILDRPSVTNSHLFPQPSPSSKLHDLGETYFFLNGIVGQPLILQVNSTVGGQPVTLQATGLFNIDYPSEASSTTPTTTVSTTEATPPPPTKSPTTIKQIIPSPDTKPPTMSSTSAATTTPTTSTSSSTRATTHLTAPSKQQACTCPKTTCPTVTKPTAVISTCPPVIQPSPCPTVNKQPLSSSLFSTKSTKSTSLSTTSTKLSSTKSSPTTGKPDPTTMATHRIKSTSPTTDKFSGQHHDDPSSNTGFSGGVIAAIAIVMLVIGLGFGIVGLRLFQIYKKHRDPEGKNILSNYLDDERRY